jgi:hypothetical protein
MSVIFKPVIASDVKIVSPKELPEYLVRQRIKIWSKMLGEEEPFPRFSATNLKKEVPEGARRELLREIYRKYFDALSPFFHRNVRLIGGVVGGQPDSDTLEQLSRLQYAAWRNNDGNLKGVQDYLRGLEGKTLDVANNPTPIVAYFRDNFETGEVGNTIEAAVFPRQVKGEDVTFWDNVTKKDTLMGDVLVCPMICSHMTIKGVGRSLIVEGVLPYAAVLAYFRPIFGLFDLIAYSRPTNKPAREDVSIVEHVLNDPNWASFHCRNVSKLLCVVPDGINAELAPHTLGRGFVVGYTAHLRPSDGMLAVLKTIEKDVTLALELLGYG